MGVILVWADTITLGVAALITVFPVGIYFLFYDVGCSGSELHNAGLESLVMQ